MSKSGILNYKELYKKAKELIAEYDVRTPSEYTQARSLSGESAKSHYCP